MSDEQRHEAIWLQPWCDGCEKNAYGNSEGRMWCQDDVWGKCEECEQVSVKYVLAAPPQVDSGREEIARALEPFAKIADDYDAADEHRSKMFRDQGRAAGSPLSDGHRVSISLGDCRNARLALRPDGEGG